MKTWLVELRTVSKLFLKILLQGLVKFGAVTHLPSECVWGILTLLEISLSLPEITPTLSEITPTLPKITQTLPEITLVRNSPRDHLRL